MNQSNDNTGGTPCDETPVTEEMVRRWTEGEEPVPSDVLDTLRERLATKRVQDLRRLPLNNILAQLGDLPVPAAVQVLVEQIAAADHVDARWVQKTNLRDLIAEFRRTGPLPSDVEAWLVDVILQNEEVRLRFLSVERILKEFQQS